MIIVIVTIIITRPLPAFGRPVPDITIITISIILSRPVSQTQHHHHYHLNYYFQSWCQHQEHDKCHLLGDAWFLYLWLALRQVRTKALILCLDHLAGKAKKFVANKQILRALDLKSSARPCLEFSLAWFPTTGLLFSLGWWWVRWRWSSCNVKIEDYDHHVSTKLMTLMMNLAIIGGSHHQWSFSCRLCSRHGDGRTSVQVLFHHDVVCAWIKSVMIHWKKHN